MDVAMMQPNFMPWQGLFELIHRADYFIFLDDFQFSVQSYNQRNRLFINKGQVGWYTVPIRKSVSFKSPLNKTVINDDIPWRAKMWKRIQHNYSRAPYYEEMSGILRPWLLRHTESLAEQNIMGIKIVCECLGLSTNFVLSSQYPSDARRSGKILELLRQCEATRYLSAKGSWGYMREDGIFPVPGVEVVFQNFMPKAYPQVGSPEEFIPFLSIFDALMNIGPEATLNLIKEDTQKWLTWDEMLFLQSEVIK